MFKSILQNVQILAQKYKNNLSFASSCSLQLLAFFVIIGRRFRSLLLESFGSSTSSRLLRS